MRRSIPVAFLAGLALLFAQPAAAQVALPKSQVNTAQPVFCVDPSTGLAASCAGSVSATTTAKATAASPSYVEGTTTNPLSVDLTGFLRVRDDTLAALVAAAIPAGTNIIGKVGIDQTTPGTTNGTQDASSSATGSAVPAKAMYQGAVSSGNLVGLIQADASAKVSISTNTITQVVALASSKKIYVTSFNLHAAGTTTSKWVYGTGSNCGTGTTDLTDLYDFTASDGMSSGSGIGPVLVVPASNALCISNSAAVHVGGSIAYTQF